MAIIKNTVSQIGFEKKEEKYLQTNIETGAIAQRYLDEAGRRIVEYLLHRTGVDYWWYYSAAERALMRAREFGSDTKMLEAKLGSKPRPLTARSLDTSSNLNR